MTMFDDPGIDELLEKACRGDPAARGELLLRYRDRLRRMIAVRADRRLAARVDPSDIVQEALTEATRHLSDYLRRRPLPFYPWLRRLAWERLAAAHRHHFQAGKRNLSREVSLANLVSGASALADRLAASDTSPSGHVARKELRRRIEDALLQVDEHDREVLVLRYLEQLSTEETAAVLGITASGVRSRLMRALVQLRQLAKIDGWEASS
jgi:RNA polymerase sigma-70 factor (ECF subfamily)